MFTYRATMKKNQKSIYHDAQKQKKEYNKIMSEKRF